MQAMVEKQRQQHSGKKALEEIENQTVSSRNFDNGRGEWDKSTVPVFSRPT